MLRKLLVLILSFVVVSSVSVAFWAGTFDKVRISEETVGPLNLIYREYNGPYSGIRYIINNVHKYVTVQKRQKVTKTFSIFTGLPEQNASNKIQSICGVISDSVIADSSLYKSSLFPKTDCIVGRFPLRSFFSYESGAHAFYPALEKYTKDRGIKITGQIMELYDLKAKTILYCAPLTAAALQPIPPK